MKYDSENSKVFHDLTLLVMLRYQGHVQVQKVFYQNHLVPQRLLFSSHILAIFLHNSEHQQKLYEK